MNEEVESKKKKKSIIVIAYFTIALILFLLFLLTGQHRTCAGSCYFAVGAVVFVILAALLGEKPKGLNRCFLCFFLILLTFFILSMLYDNCIESLPVPKIYVRSGDLGMTLHDLRNLTWGLEVSTFKMAGRVEVELATRVISSSTYIGADSEEIL